MFEFSEDMIQDNDSEIALTEDMFPEEAQPGPAKIAVPQEFDEGEVDDIIRLHMDLRQPLSFLRTILEQKLSISLRNFQFWLQNQQMLESHKTLGDQCVKGEGIAQINVQVITLSKQINIVDVLKPSEDELVDVADSADDPTLSEESSNEKAPEVEEGMDTTPEEEEEEEGDTEPVDEKPVVAKWIADEKFKSDQSRLGIPPNPMEWSVPMVRHWIQWAVRQFNLAQIKLQDWTINGKTLCAITFEDYQRKVPSDPGDIFWTHLQLLRKYQMVAVLQRNGDDSNPDERKELQVIRKTVKLGKSRAPLAQTSPKSGDLDAAMSQTKYEYPCGNRTGNNGQIQLWQFLLDILTDRSCRDIIQWMGGSGEFKLKDPERVAQLWGERKNKPTMNYEKLSRALRYYYDGDMISKVHGKRFVYQFVCNLRQLIGYTAEELAALVAETPDETLQT